MASTSIICKPEATEEDGEESQYIFLNGVKYSIDNPKIQRMISNSKLVEQTAEYQVSCAQQNKRQRVKQIETYRKEITTDEYDEEEYAEAPPPSQPAAASSTAPEPTETAETTEAEAAVYNYRQKRMRCGGVVRDAEWAMERVIKTPVWVPVMEPWKMDLERLRQEGEPVVPIKCFGCAYEQYEGGNVVNAARWNVLLAAFLNNLGNCGSMYDLGKELYEIFKSNVLQLFHTSHDEDAEEPEPVWSSYGLMYHFLYHNASPQIRGHMLITRQQSVVNTILEHNLYELNLHSGRMQINTEGLKKLNIAIEIESKLRKMRFEELPFSTKRFQLNTDGLSLLNTKMPIIGSSGHSFRSSSSPISQKKWN